MMIGLPTRMEGAPVQKEDYLNLLKKCFIFIFYLFFIESRSKNVIVWYLDFVRSDNLYIFLILILRFFKW